MFTSWYTDAKQVHVLSTIQGVKSGTLPPQPEADGSGHTSFSIPSLGQRHPKELRHYIGFHGKRCGDVEDDLCLSAEGWSGNDGHASLCPSYGPSRCQWWWVNGALRGVFLALNEPHRLMMRDNRMGKGRAVPITGGDGLHGGKLGRHWQRCGMARA